MFRETAIVSVWIIPLPCVFAEKEILLGYAQLAMFLFYKFFQSYAGGLSLRKQNDVKGLREYEH